VNIKVLMITRRASMVIIFCWLLSRLRRTSLVCTRSDAHATTIFVAITFSTPCISSYSPFDL